MATMTEQKRGGGIPKTGSIDPLIDDPTKRQFDEEGFEIRYERVDGAWVGFSMKPYPDGRDAQGVYHAGADERPLYWNPIYPGGEMRWRSPHLNSMGFQPTIQKEQWTDGVYRPRNDWELHMTREWMMRSLPGCNDPEQWRGVNHPEGPTGEWRCQCTWHTGNWKAFHAHRRYLRHQESMSDFT
jgi:hypothetical protein